MSTSEQRVPSLPFFMHFRRMEPDGNGGKRQVSEYAVTVCITPDLCDRCLRAGVAICGPRDHFSRRTGRNIALGRAHKGHGPTVPTARLVGLDDARRASLFVAAMAIRDAFRPKDAERVLEDVFGA